MHKVDTGTHYHQVAVHWSQCCQSMPSVLWVHISNWAHQRTWVQRHLLWESQTNSFRERQTLSWDGSASEPVLQPNFRCASQFLLQNWDYMDFSVHHSPEWFSASAVMYCLMCVDEHPVSRCLCHPLLPGASTFDTVLWTGKVDSFLVHVFETESSSIRYTGCTDIV